MGSISLAGQVHGSSSSDQAAGRLCSSFKTVTDTRRHLDRTDEVGVQLGRFGRRDPVLEDGPISHLIEVIPFKELLPDPEARHVAKPLCLTFQSPRDHGRVLLVHDRVEDRLLRQPRWPSHPA